MILVGRAISQFKVSDRRRNTPESAHNRSESLGAGLWVPCLIFWAWFGPAFLPNPVRNQRFPAGSLKVFGTLSAQQSPAGLAQVIPGRHTSRNRAEYHQTGAGHRTGRRCFPSCGMHPMLSAAARRGFGGWGFSDLIWLKIGHFGGLGGPWGL